MDSKLVWADIFLDNLASNIHELRKITNPDADIMAVVKANAYGHGMLKVSEVALKNGANCFGVARINEAIELRKAGFLNPILIFGYTPPEFFKYLIKYDIMQTVYSTELAAELSDFATQKGKEIKIHIKIDTGMGRLGFLVDSFRIFEFKRIINDIYSIGKLPKLNINGIYTHFATADSENKKYAKKQFERFCDLLDKINKIGLKIPIRHAANSAALIEMPETHLDMVRPGISMYGLYPSDDIDKSKVLLKPVMELKTRIIHLKKVSAGFKISYGSTYETKNATTIATIPVGYADGLNRLLSSKGYVMVCGQKTPIVGRVCMDQTMLDVGHIKDVSLNSEVVIFGNQQGRSIGVDEIAINLNTINYEIVSTVTNRVPRFYNHSNCNY